ncbi:tyrosine-type recombinase/integrase [Specibacter sp. NPDC078709]|uniref:tyrosine-type recombinase/integrase n=1 Tax=Specibacter sp. NPDC078709 TaxID=3154364 RepID=UPI003442A163
MVDGTRPPSPLLQLLDNVHPLHEGEFVFDAMLSGWHDQQVSRGLAASTVTSRILFIRRFANYCDKLPWQWIPGDVEDFTVHCSSGDGRLAKSTIRAYQARIRVFCAFITDTRYDWIAQCQKRFGCAPQQICHEWNTTAHIADYEGRPERRALTYDELDSFFGHADGRVESIVQSGKKGALAALRDTQIFKTVYAFGLRRAEAVGLDIADLRPNPASPRFGHYGSLDVRWGKGSNGSGPRRRTILALPEFDWAIDGLRQWVEMGRMRVTNERRGALWPTERGTRVSLRYLDDRFAEIRDGAGLPKELSLHSLRHSYVTNLIEWGYSEKFVQDQVGHLYASTTAIYTSVGSDYKNRVIARALSRVYGDQNAHS